MGKRRSGGLSRADACPQHRGRRSVARPVSVDLAQTSRPRGGEDDHGYPAGRQRPMWRMHPDEHAASLAVSGLLRSVDPGVGWEREDFGIFARGEAFGMG